MDGLQLIVNKALEKRLVNEIKQAICNDPNKSISQKQIELNRIDAVSSKKDAYDIMRIVKEMNLQSGIVKEGTSNE